MNGKGSGLLPSLLILLDSLPLGHVLFRLLILSGHFQRSRSCYPRELALTFCIYLHPWNSPLKAFTSRTEGVRGHCCKPPFNLIVLLFHPKHPAAPGFSRLEGGRRYFLYGRDLAHLGSVPVALHSHFLGTLDASLKEDQERGELDHILPSWYIIPTSTMSPCHSCPQFWHFNRKKCLV